MGFNRLLLLISPLLLLCNGDKQANSSVPDPRDPSRPSLGYPVTSSVLFIFTTLFIGVIVRSIMLWTNKCPPYRVVMFAIGGAVGFCTYRYPKFRPLVEVCFIDVDILLTVFLPILVFTTSYNVDSHGFWKSIPQILLVAVPGVLLTAILVAFMAHFVIENSWDLPTSVLFGVVCSPIYPMEVVKQLKEISKGKYLSILLLGEGLIGDVTVVIAFTAVLGYLGFALTETSQITLMLLRFAGGGILMGVIAGKLISTVLSLSYYDLLSAVTVTFAGAYLTYYIGEKFLYVSGLLGSVTAGIIISNNKSTIATDVEPIISQFWTIMLHGANTLLFTMVGVVIFERLSHVVTVSQVAFVFVTYTTVYCARLLVYFLMMPALERLGYGITWHHSMACVWGGLKGPLSLCLALVVLQISQGESGTSNTGEVFIIQTTGLVLLSLLINATAMHKVLKVLGLDEISLAKKANMTNCVKRIMMTRDRSISMLKMDKFLADANWDLVQEGTTIKHPYQFQLSGRDDDTEDDTYMGYRYTTCPDCEREIPNEPTKKEFAEMMREANQRVFKALKISYWRQYEHGKISKDGVRTLVQAIEVAADSPGGKINLDQLSNLWKPKAHAIWLRHKLINMMTPKAANSQVPCTPWRQTCYRIINKIWFDIAIYVTILFNTPVILCDVFLRTPVLPLFMNVIKGLNLFFYLIYLLEMIIKMCALGVFGYFQSHWNKLDFFIIFMATGDLVLDIIDSLTVWDKYANLNSSLLTATKLLRMLRFLRLFKLARVSVPKIMAYIDRMIDIQLAFGYDVGKGFVTGQQEVSNLLPQLVDHPQIQATINAKLESDRLTVTRQLGLLQRDRPWTAITVKTRQATTSTLNVMCLDAMQLKEEGFLDEMEYRSLVSSIQQKIQLCRHKGSLVAPCSPETQLRAVSWLQGNERVADFFIENSEIINFNYNDLLVSRGDMPKGVFILVSGLLEASYEPPDCDTDEAIPNYEFFTDLKFSDPVKEFIVSGNAVGILGVLTNRPYNYSVRCDTAVQAYHITIPTIKEALNLAPHPILGFCIINGTFTTLQCPNHVTVWYANVRFIRQEVTSEAIDVSGTANFLLYNVGRLEAAMWREIGIKIALMLLPTVPAYHGWSSEKLSLRLEHAFVPCLKAFKVFVVNELMEDIVLIDGVCQDMATREIFQPPCYIPRTVHRLVFPKSSQLLVSSTCPETRLLLVPSKDVDEMDIMVDEIDDINVELISNVSSRCLYHRALRRASSEQRLLRRRPRRRRAIQRRLNYRESVWSRHLTSNPTIIASTEKELASNYFRLMPEKPDQHINGEASTQRSIGNPLHLRFDSEEEV